MREEDATGPLEVRALYCERRRDLTAAMGDEPGLLLEGASGDELIGLCVYERPSPWYDVWEDTGVEGSMESRGPLIDRE